MANTYYDSELTAEEIEEVLEAINGILTPVNNGKVLAISNGKFEARSVQWGGGGEAVIEPLSVTENGTYTAPPGVDGYSPVTVNVSGGGGGSGNILYGTTDPISSTGDDGSIYLKYKNYTPPSGCTALEYIETAGGNRYNGFRSDFKLTENTKIVIDLQVYSNKYYKWASKCNRYRYL